MIEILPIILFIVLICFCFSVFLGAPFVPSRKAWAESAIDLIKPSKSDLVVDLGSGDGQVLKILAERGVKSVGYEINPILVLFSFWRLKLLGAKLAKVKLKNFWRTNLPPATTAVYVFAVERDAQKLKNYLIRQAKLVKSPKLQVVAFGFKIPQQKVIKKTNSAFLYEF